MGSSTVIRTFVVAACVASAWATISLGSFPSVVDIGRTYDLNWTATENYTYNLWLVLDDPDSYGQGDYDWTRVATLASGLLFPTLDGNYTWIVPSNLSVTSDYGIWFGCFPNENDTTTMYTITTPYFAINNSTATTTSVSSTSATPVATSSSVATSAAAEGSVHHNKLSGGAIAGIVIGVIAAVLLLLGALLLLRKHRRGSEAERREAAARAERLAPVTKQSFNGYEMHAQSPNLNSVTIEHPTITTTTTTRL